MEKMKRFALYAMLILSVSVTAACGRNHKNNGAGETSSQINGPSASGIDNSGVRADEEDGMGPTVGTSGETGGVLRDMVDDVKDGLEDVGDGVRDGMEDVGDGVKDMADPTS